jgi:hypothetical protein
MEAVTSHTGVGHAPETPRSWSPWPRLGRVLDQMGLPGEKALPDARDKALASLPQSAADQEADEVAADHLVLVLRDQADQPRIQRMLDALGRTDLCGCLTDHCLRWAAELREVLLVRT